MLRMLSGLLAGVYRRLLCRDKHKTGFSKSTYAARVAQALWELRLTLELHEFTSKEDLDAFIAAYDPRWTFRKESRHRNRAGPRSQHPNPARDKYRCRCEDCRPDLYLGMLA